ncbi:MAG: hypothetical protein IJW64_05150 [Clostridia bacterium]|nr:hypothetical protein [Clostridia bacterium]
MGKLKFKVHPLFIILGIYFAFTGKVFSFLVYTISALIHELGHSLKAQKAGYRLINVTLMPFGAIIKGDISGMGYKDEIAVSLAGPMVNFLVGVFLVALWWVFPESYPYTELAVQASFALFLINLIPAFPLDGGRILLCTLSLFLKRKTALLICKAVGLIFACLFFGLFLYSCFIGVNYSILSFGVFMLIGVFENHSENRFVRLYQSLSSASLKGGKIIKEIAFDDKVTIKRLYGKIDSGYLYRVFIYSDSGNLKKVLQPHEIVNLLQTKAPYEKLI